MEIAGHGPGTAQLLKTHKDQPQARLDLLIRVQDNLAAAEQAVGDDLGAAAVVPDGQSTPWPSVPGGAVPTVSPGACHAPARFSRRAVRLR